jgi:hypothetical protein
MVWPKVDSDECGKQPGAVNRPSIPLLAVTLIALLSGYSQQAFAQVFPNDPEFPKQYGFHNAGQVTGFLLIE